MTSETGQQTIAMHILPNISGSKGNQTVTFGQLIKCSMRNIIFKNLAENELPSPKLFPDLFFPKNALCEVKARDQHLSLNIFW